MFRHRPLSVGLPEISSALLTAESAWSLWRRAADLMPQRCRQALQPASSKQLKKRNEGVSGFRRLIGVCTCPGGRPFGYRPCVTCAPKEAQTHTNPPTHAQPLKQTHQHSNSARLAQVVGCRSRAEETAAKVHSSKCTLEFSQQQTDSSGSDSSPLVVVTSFEFSSLQLSHFVPVPRLAQTLGT